MHLITINVAFAIKKLYRGPFISIRAYSDSKNTGPFLYMFANEMVEKKICNAETS